MKCVSFLNSDKNGQKKTLNVKNIIAVDSKILEDQPHQRRENISEANKKKMLKRMEEMGKKTALIFCINILITICISAQTEFKEKPFTFAPDWEEFSIKDSTVFTQYFEYKNVNEKNAVRKYQVNTDTFYLGQATYFFIFSDPLKNPRQTKKVFEFIKYSEGTGKTITINNFRGKKFKFLGKDGFYHTILAVKSHNRFYIFQTTSELENNLKSDNFFAGIQIHSPNIPPKREGKGYGIGPGSGNGSAICGGEGDPSIVYTPLIILSKPVAEYTDFARFYEIEGSVSLEVKYLESGELGEIKPRWKLPFGLTESAFESAKLIKFKPPTANGRPFPITRWEHYVFSLTEKKK